MWLHYIIIVYVHIFLCLHFLPPITIPLSLTSPSNLHHHHKNTEYDFVTC